MSKKNSVAERSKASSKEGRTSKAQRSTVDSGGSAIPVSRRNTNISFNPFSRRQSKKNIEDEYMTNTDDEEEEEEVDSSSTTAFDAILHSLKDEQLENEKNSLSNIEGNESISSKPVSRKETIVSFKRETVSDDSSKIIQEGFDTSSKSVSRRGTTDSSGFFGQRHSQSVGDDITVRSSIVSDLKDPADPVKKEDDKDNKDDNNVKKEDSEYSDDDEEEDENEVETEYEEDENWERDSEYPSEDELGDYDDDSYHTEEDTQEDVIGESQDEFSDENETETEEDVAKKRVATEKEKDPEVDTEPEKQEEKRSSVWKRCERILILICQLSVIFYLLLYAFHEGPLTMFKKLFSLTD